MFFLAAIVVATGAAVAIGAALIDEAECQYNNWVEKRGDLEDEIIELTEQIEDHLEEARYSFNIKILKADRRASIDLANTAYKLYRDAQHALKAFGHNIVRTNQEISKYYNQRKESHDQSVKSECTKEIKNLKAYKTILFRTNDSLKQEKENYYNQLRKLNRQTAKLRDMIEEYYNKKNEQRWGAKSSFFSFF
jgi:chromosome segregation ATPase